MIFIEYITSLKIIFLILLHLYKKYLHYCFLTSLRVFENVQKHWYLFYIAYYNSVIFNTTLFSSYINHRKQKIFYNFFKININLFIFFNTSSIINIIFLDKWNAIWHYLLFLLFNISVSLFYYLSFLSLVIFLVELLLTQVLVSLAEMYNLSILI